MPLSIRHLAPAVDKPGRTSALLARLPGWSRTPFALIAVALIVIAPVVVTLLRSSHFDVTVEVFPTTPPGNASASYPSPGDFEGDTAAWVDPPAFAISRSTTQAHSGTASLAAVRDRGTPIDGNAGFSYFAFRRPGTYHVEAWVRLPRDYGGGPPGVYLEGFVGSKQIGRKLGDPRVHERWQRVAADYLVSANDLDGFVVLRVILDLPRRGQVLYWDDVSLPPRETNSVSNPGFEYGTSGWGDPPAFAVMRSERRAHSGSASLASYRDRRAPPDGNSSYTYLVLPGAGVYRAQAWVYLPRGFRGGAPAIYLEGFAGSTQLAPSVGNPKRRGTWQLVTNEYSVSDHDLAGSLVLRVIEGLPAPRQVMYWDDVLIPLSQEPKPASTTEAGKQFRRLEGLVGDQQLRLEISQAAGKDLYAPGHVTIARSHRSDALSFLLTVATDTPSDALRLQDQLQAALVQAATRSRIARAQAALAEVTRELERNVGPRQRALLLQRQYDLQQLIATQPADFVVSPSRSTSDPDDFVDRVLEKMPGPFLPRPSALSVGSAGLLSVLLLYGLLLGATAIRGGTPPDERGRA